MKTKDLIRELQEADPSGELEVCDNYNQDIYFVDVQEAYYDGCLQTLIRDETKKPYYHIAGLKYHSKGYKVRLHTTCLDNILLNNPNALVEYDSEYTAKKYQDRVAGRRVAVLEIRNKVTIDCYYSHLKDKISNPPTWEEVYTFFETHHLWDLKIPKEQLDNNNSRSDNESNFYDSIIDIVAGKMVLKNETHGYRRTTT